MVPPGTSSVATCRRLSSRPRRAPKNRPGVGAGSPSVPAGSKGSGSGRHGPRSKPFAAPLQRAGWSHGAATAGGVNRASSPLRGRFRHPPAVGRCNRVENNLTKRRPHPPSVPAGSGAKRLRGLPGMILNARVSPSAPQRRRTCVSRWPFRLAPPLRPPSLTTAKRQPVRAGPFVARAIGLTIVDYRRNGLVASASSRYFSLARFPHPRGACRWPKRCSRWPPRPAVVITRLAGALSCGHSPRQLVAPPRWRRFWPKLGLGDGLRVLGPRGFWNGIEGKPGASA